MRFDNLIALAALLLTAYFSLATSRTKDATSPTTGPYYVISDCSTPPTESVVTVVNSSITVPSNVSFTDFGFPLPNIAQTVSGPVAGAANRECTVTYGEDGTNYVKNRWLYSCFDDGQFKCSIYVQPQ